MRTTTAICALFALLAVATAARRGVYTPPTAGKRYTSDSFDFLLFVQQWPGTLWNTAPKGVDGFTIHGLWPNNNDTGGPSFCTSATFDPSEVSSLLDELNVQWPSNQGDNEAFWAHEYEKHGTCAAVLPSLKTEYDFFSSVLQLNTKYDLISALADADIYPSWDKTYTLDAIKTALGDAGMPPLLYCNSSSDASEGTPINSIQLCVSKYSFTPYQCNEAMQKQADEGGHCNSQAITIPPIST